jgi:RNA polymerase sigma factor (sigma-70 family)
LTEQQLIHALQQKQESAFKQLVEDYKDRLYNTVLGFVQSEADAEDVVQDVFIKVYENIRDFKGDASIGTWMYRIAVTQALDWLRKRKRKKRGLGLLTWFGAASEEKQEQHDFNHPGVLAENKERASHLFAAMDKLPANQKTAFVLQKLEGMQQREIAAVMQVNEGAVESLLTRAKTNLRKSLQEYYSS